MLATTNRDFPLQLWDRLAPQVQDTLNLIRASRINPNILAYEALNGPYNWDRYPLAPPGCKAIIYKAPAVRGSWASRGTDAWYLGPLADHYRCNIYYVPETREYRISGSAELFPQHCQVPNLSNNAHLKALTKELEVSTGIAAKTHKGRTLIQSLGKAIKAILNPPIASKQRVDVYCTIFCVVRYFLQTVCLFLVGECFSLLLVLFLCTLFLRDCHPFIVRTH